MIHLPPLNETALTEINIAAEDPLLCCKTIQEGHTDENAPANPVGFR